MVSYKYTVYTIALLIISNFYTHAMDKPSMKGPDIWTVIQQGNIVALKVWVRNKDLIPGGINGKKYGMTPLLTLASVPSDKLAPAVYREAWDLLLKAGADITAQDREGFTVLHKVAMHGEPTTFYSFLRDKPELKQLINMPAGPEKRTPIQIALRALPQALIRLDIADKEFTNKKDFDAALDEAIKELDQKTARRPSLGAVAMLIRDLVSSGADATILDKAGHPLSYNINNFLLISDKDRQTLYKALKLQPVEKKVTYSMVDLRDAITEIDMLIKKNPKFAAKLTMARWAIENAMAEQKEELAYKTLRVALALLAKINFDAQSNITEKVQAIVHDAATQLMLYHAGLPEPTPEQPAVAVPAAAQTHTEEEVLEAR